MSELDVGSSPVSNPDALYEALLRSCKHPRKRSNLEKLQEICRERFEAKALEWSYSSIGRAMERLGSLTVQSLLQKQSLDYRALIDAWRVKAEISNGGLARKSMATPQRWYDGIGDLWIRQAAAALEREVEILRKKNQLLEKWKGTVEVRLDGTPADPDARTGLLGLLSIQEKRALSDSISATSLARKQLYIGSRGELVVDGGLVYFGPGWATGLRKLLNVSGPAGMP